MTITSSSSGTPHSQKKEWPAWLILALLSLLSVGGYILTSAIYYRTGFPLDDAWIHQTYARNLALHLEWAFFPGRSSGGSTAPLWSALLAIGFLIRLAPYAWTYLLGALAMWGISMLGEKTIRGFVPTYRPHFPWVGAILTVEWHLVWAAASGMETLLYALLVSAVLILIMSNSPRYFSLGLLIGLSVWVRPDGITLLGPAVLMILISQPSWAKRLRKLVNLGVGFGSPFAIYLLFNLIISGHPWPNTFYAKQAEYAVYLELPFLVRLGGEALQPLIGAGVIMLPGAILAVISAIRRRYWGVLATFAWLVGFLILYAWKLPVTYQHGRYVIPVMPIYFILGLAGLLGSGMNGKTRIKWLISTFWRIAVGAVLVVFWVRGAYSYAQDVAFIESEMVATAKWISVNVPPDKIVAVHDIGALGYFGGHQLVDLAGLISPEVIPFLRDQGQITTYLNERGVSYLAVFPDWYPSLTANLSPIFTTEAPFAPAMGEKNMAVYRWQSR